MAISARPFRYPHRIEEDDQRASPVPPHRQKMAPAPRALHLMRREVNRVELWLGQVMPPAISRCGLSLGNRGSAFTRSCSHAHDRTARRCDRTLLAVRPGCCLAARLRRRGPVRGTCESLSCRGVPGGLRRPTATTCQASWDTLTSIEHFDYGVGAGYGDRVYTMAPSAPQTKGC